MKINTKLDDESGLTIQSFNFNSIWKQQAAIIEVQLNRGM